MIFLFEERRAFVRTATHTVVLDRDEDYDFMCASGTGTVARLVRIWTVRFDGAAAVPTAYLGSVTLCRSMSPRAQLLGLLRRLAARDDRRRLLGLLRRFAADAA